MFVIMSSDGEMNLQEVSTECRKNCWCPILSAQVGEEKFVPEFHLLDVAKQFMKRNMPKGWLSGVVNLTDEDRKTLQASGVNLKLYSFPSKLYEANFGVEIVNFSSEPEVCLR